MSDDKSLHIPTGHQSLIEAIGRTYVVWNEFWSNRRAARVLGYSDGRRAQTYRIQNWRAVDSEKDAAVTPPILNSVRLSPSTPLSISLRSCFSRRSTLNSRMVRGQLATEIGVNQLAMTFGGLVDHTRRFADGEELWQI